MQTTNAMTTALVSAGFPAMPINKRVWLWLHDHPGKTCKEVSAALGVPQSSISVALKDLVDRNMALRTPRNRFTSKGVRPVFEYTTRIREYELLPRPSKKSASKAGASAAPIEKAPEQKPPAERGQPDALAFRRNLPYGQQPINVKDLPLSEALRLYGELKAVFGDRA